jgi:hypothetical protein
MRKVLLTALGAATVLGAGGVAPALHAQPYVVYPPAAALVEPGYRYDADGRPYYDDGYRAPGYHAPEGAAVLGPALADSYSRVPYDRYGPDPNGLFASDGHRIKCKLEDTYDDRVDRYMTRRVCD